MLLPQGALRRNNGLILFGVDRGNKKWLQEAVSTHLVALVSCFYLVESIIPIKRTLQEET